MICACPPDLILDAKESLESGLHSEGIVQSSELMECAFKRSI
jgi:hypothetical protein